MEIVIDVRSDFRQRYAELNREVDQLVTQGQGLSNTQIIEPEAKLWRASVRKVREVYESLAKDLSRGTPSDKRLQPDMRSLDRKIAQVERQILEITIVCVATTALATFLVVMTPTLVRMCL